MSKQNETARSKEETRVILQPEKLYHCTTIKKAKRYRDTGAILKPVRGFENVTAALAWCMKTGRNIVYEIDDLQPKNVHKLPDHHNKFGNAWWLDYDVENYKCIWSVNS